MFRNLQSKLFPSSLLLLGLNVFLRADVPIYPGPAFDSTTTNGFTNGEIPDGNGITLNFIGQAIGIADKYTNGNFEGTRAFRWDPSGDVIEMQTLGTNASGIAYSTAYGINSVQQVVGSATKYVAGVNKGDRAVLWDQSGNALELSDIGVNDSGVANSGALAINSSGDIVGYAEEWVLGNYQGVRPVRWDDAGNAAEMNVLGTNSLFQTDARAYSINNNGFSTGYSNKYISNTLLGRRPTRWNTNGQVTELPVLGTDAGGSGYGAGVFINSAGEIAGFAQKYVSNFDKGQRAVVWNPAGAIIELGNLGLSSADETISIANHINDTGDIVGTCDKYTAGVNKGYRAVRWDSAGNITELADLGTTATGVTHSEAYSINSIGQIAGYAEKYITGNLVGRRAMVWQADGSAIDLNSFISNSSKWVFNTARSITTTGWVNGVGTYDPDSVGPLPGYSRLFTIKITNDVIWTNPSGGSWQTGTNWSSGFTPGVTLGTTFNLPNSYTVSLSANEEVANIGITAGNITYALNNNTLTTTGQINVASGTLTVSNGVLKTAGLVSKGIVNVDSGAIIEVTSLGDEIGVSTFKQLNIPTTVTGYAGTIQLHQNDMIIDYDGQSTPYAQIVAMLKSGLTILGGEGTGITSDFVDSGLLAGSMIGMLDNGAIDGTYVSLSGFRDFSANSVIVKFTWFGDANLDGIVDGSDYALLDTGFTDPLNHQGWVFGDMDYNGYIDMQDYGLTDTGYIAQMGSLPEPAILGSSAILSMLFLKRPSRHLAR